MVLDFCTCLVGCDSWAMEARFSSSAVASGNSGTTQRKNKSFQFDSEVSSRCNNELIIIHDSSSFFGVTEQKQGYHPTNWIHEWILSPIVPQNRPLCNLCFVVNDSGWGTIDAFVVCVNLIRHLKEWKSHCVMAALMKENIRILKICVVDTIMKSLNFEYCQGVFSYNISIIIESFYARWANLSWQCHERFISSPSSFYSRMSKKYCTLNGWGLFFKFRTPLEIKNKKWTFLPLNRCTMMKFFTCHHHPCLDCIDHLP